MKLGELHEKLEESSESENLDPYSKAHLIDAKNRVKKYLDGTYVVNQESGGGGFGGFSFLFGKDGQPIPQPQPQK